MKPVLALGTLLVFFNFTKADSLSITEALYPGMSLNNNFATSLNASRVFARHAYPSTGFAVTNSAGNALVVAVSTTSAAHAVWDSKSNTWQHVMLACPGVYVTHLSLSVATGISAGSNWVGVIGGSDSGITIAEYSGLSSIDTLWAASTSATNHEFTLTSPAIFVVAWADEASPYNFATNFLSPGNVAPTLISNDANHYDRQSEWLNGGAGMGAGTWTLTCISTNVSPTLTAWAAAVLR